MVSGVNEGNWVKGVGVTNDYGGLAPAFLGHEKDGAVVCRDSMLEETMSG